MRCSFFWITTVDFLNWRGLFKLDSPTFAFAFALAFRRPLSRARLFSEFGDHLRRCPFLRALIFSMTKRTTTTACCYLLQFLEGF